jgi:hypothetical protein
MTTDTDRLRASGSPATHRAARVCSKCGRRALTAVCAKCGGVAVVQCVACELPIARCEVLMGDVKREMESAASTSSARPGDAPTASEKPAPDPGRAVAQVAGSGDSAGGLAEDGGAQSESTTRSEAPSVFSLAEGEALRALTALLVDSLYRAGSTSDAAVVMLMRRLLARELDDVALELGVAAARIDERFQKMTPVLTALWNAHFGEVGSEYSDHPVSAPTRLDPPVLGAAPGTNAPPPTSNVVLESIRLSARLRPHARGTLTSWERTLVRQELG